MSNLDLVNEFNKKFSLPTRIKPSFPDPEVIKLRMDRLKEEVEEICDSVANGDLDGVLDGLIDLEYILHGTTLAFGLQNIYQTAFRRVHMANMKKTRAVLREDSKHGTTYDIVKPKGWEPPEFDDLFKAEEEFNG